MWRMVVRTLNRMIAPLRPYFRACRAALAPARGTQPRRPACAPSARIVVSDDEIRPETLQGGLMVVRAAIEQDGYPSTTPCLWMLRALEEAAEHGVNLLNWAATFTYLNRRSIAVARLDSPLNAYSETLVYLSAGDNYARALVSLGLWYECPVARFSLDSATQTWDLYPPDWEFIPDDSIGDDDDV